MSKIYLQKKSTQKNPKNCKRIWNDVWHTRKYQFFLLLFGIVFCINTPRTRFIHLVHKGTRYSNFESVQFLSFSTDEIETMFVYFTLFMYCYFNYIDLCLICGNWLNFSVIYDIFHFHKSKKIEWINEWMNIRCLSFSQPFPIVLIWVVFFFGFGPKIYCICDYFLFIPYLIYVNRKKLISGRFVSCSLLSRVNFIGENVLLICNLTKK